MAHAIAAVPALSPPRRLTERLVAMASGWAALVSVVVFVVFTALVLPPQAARAREYTGEAGSPDSSFWYTPDQLMGWAAAYGAEGRSAYVTARLTFDVVWPLVYTAMLVLVLGWLLGKATSPGSTARLALLLPLAALLFDYAENVSAAVVMARYPETTPVLAWLAPLFTAGKWTTLSLAFLAVPVAAVAALLARRRA